MKIKLSPVSATLRPLVLVIFMLASPAMGFDAGPVRPSDPKPPAWTVGDVLGGAAEVAKGGSTAHDALMGSVDGAGKLKASKFSRLAGNAGYRQHLANEYNSLVKNLQSASKNNMLPLVSQAVQVTDTGSTLLGYASVGTTEGLGTQIVQAGAQNLTVAAGTLIGAKTFGAIGAGIGSFVPVVGTAAGGMIGGAVGGAGAAVLTSLGYDSFLKSYVEKGSDAFFGSFEFDPKAKAMLSRAEFLGEKEREELAKQHRYDVGNQGIKEEQPVELLNPALADQLKNLQPQKKEEPSLSATPDPVQPSLVPAPDTNTALSMPPEDKEREKELMRKAETVQAAIGQGVSGDKASADGRPLLPSNCTIDLVTWDSQYTEFKFKHLMIINEGQVTGTVDYRVDAQTHGGSKCDPWRMTGQFTGSITDNVITGTWQLKTDKRRCTTGHADCVMEDWNHMTVNSSITLNLDGSAKDRFQGTSTGNVQFLGACKDVPKKNFSNTSSIPEAGQSNEHPGVWRIKQ